jgi:hypothetical protein
MHHLICRQNLSLPQEPGKTFGAYLVDAYCRDTYQLLGVGGQSRVVPKIDERWPFGL